MKMPKLLLYFFGRKSRKLREGTKPCSIFVGKCTLIQNEI